MIAYPARLEAEGDGMVMLTLPDVPELVVVARRKGEALARARTVLDSILAGYAWQERPLPAPSRIDGAPLVSPQLYRFGDNCS
jgi:predicted RNase H-like HicB family nuclease